MNVVKPQLLLLTVVSGPDAGRCLSFRKNRVSLGRDTANDFVLTDGFVSSRHGEFVFEGDQVFYLDLRSRHGSLAIIHGISTRLQNLHAVSRLQVPDGAELQIGSSILRLELPEAEKAVPPVQAQSHRPPSFVVIEPLGGNGHEQFITSAHEPIHALTRRFDSHDKRLELLFKLSEQLNSLTTLDDILNMIVDATFEAFPGANFFGMSLISPSGDIPAPFFTRTRQHIGDDKEPILSSSIVRRVVESRESVLWVKDNLGSQLSQSIIDAKITACLCAPLVGQRKLLGVVQVDTRGRGTLFSKQDLDLFTILASNTAFAVERAELTNHIVKMFESFVDASVTAIEARDLTTAGHSQRVSAYTMELARVIHDKTEGVFAPIAFSQEQFTELRYGTLLHDFGKIAVPENILQKPTRLHDHEMENIRQRLATIKAVSQQALWRELAEALAAGRIEASAKTIADVQGRCDMVAVELDGIWAFLEDVNVRGFLKDEDVSRVESTAARQFTDTHGTTRSFLNAHEVENLSIRRGTLNEREWDLMRSHSSQSQRFLERIPWSDDLKMVPYLGGAHHEKLDGSGYPLGLTKESLNLQCRMLTVADIFDALTAADRPYRKAASVERAIDILRLEASEGKLDMDVVEVFIQEVVPRILHLIPLLYGSTTP